MIDQQSIPPLMRKTKVGSKGDFIFENLLVYDDQELVFQGANKNGKPNVDVLLASKPLEPFLNQFSLPLNTGAIMAAADRFNEKKKYRDLIDKAYNFDSTATLLETVVVEGRREDELRDDTQRKSVYGRGEDMYKPGENEVIVSANALEMISGKLSGVQVTGVGLSTQVIIRGATTGSGTPLPPHDYDRRCTHRHQRHPPGTGTGH